MPDFENESVSAFIRGASAFIFDMDGVIIDSEPLKFEAYVDVFRAHFNVRLDPQDISWKGKSEKQVCEYWLNKLCIKTAVNVAELIEHKRKAYRALIEAGRLKLIPGAQQFLLRLKTLGKKMALATNSNQGDQEIVFRQFGFTPLFDAVTTFEEVAKPKPDPEIYSTTAAKLCEHPSNCLVFEDTPVGLTAARAAGMKTICVTDFVELNKEFLWE